MLRRYDTTSLTSRSPEVLSPSPAAIAAGTRSAARTEVKIDEPDPVRELGGEPARGLDGEPALPDTARAGEGDQAYALMDHQVYRVGRFLLSVDERRRGHRKNPGRRRVRGAGLRHLEALAEQQRQVVLDQALQFGRVGEALVGDAVVVLDPGQQLGQPPISVGCG